MINVGNHISSQYGFKVMGENALKLGADTFAFFTRNPRGGSAKEIDPKDVEALIEILTVNNFGKLVAHAPYTMNVCAEKENIREFSRNMLKEDIQRMEYLPNNYYNFHPGSHVGQGIEAGIDMIADALNYAMTENQTTTVLLETMAGKGSELGSKFEELKSIIDRVKYKDKIGICMDTCHVHDGGYDIVSSLDKVLDEFDNIIGLDKLKAIHINDSMNPIGSHKDRHQKIGEGEIGIDGLKKFATHPLLKNKPFILETPNDDIGYKKEIELIRSWFEN